MAGTDRLGAYANWLVANEAKKGTPEFDTVANAYRSLRTQPAPAPDTSMGTAFKVGEAGAIASTQGYLADANRQMEQGPVGRFMQAGEDYIAKPIANALGIDRQPRVAAVAANQRELNGNAEFTAAARDKLVADTNYKSLTTDDINGVGSFLRYGGQKIAESAGPMAATIATGGAITLPMMAGEVNENLKDIEGLSEEDRVRLATGGAVISTVLENLGVGFLFNGISKPALSKMGVAGVSAVLEKNGLGRLTSRVASGVATEGLTEAGQEGVSIGAEAIGGREFTAEDVKGRLFEAGVAGGVAGGGFRGAASIAGGVTDSVKPTAREDTPENRADASFAQRIQGIAEANNYNLRDVNTASTTGARETLDKAHVQIDEDLKQTFKDMKGRVKPADLDSLETIQAKVLAQAAYREARNKTKNTVGVQEMQALEALTGDTKEGAKALNLIREMNVLTRLHNDGYKGGLSQYTDIANPFDGASNTYNSAAQVSSKVLGPLATASAAYTTGGASIPAQIGITAAGRGIDAITGRRSNINRFVKKNQDGAGLETPALPSLRQGRIDAAKLAEDQKAASEAASAASLAQRTERLKQSNKQLLKDGAPPVPTSPQGTLEEATGLDNSGVAKVLRTIEANNTDPVLKEAIDSYRTSVVYGGRVPEISSLIRKVKQMTAKYPTLARQVRPPVDRPTANGSPIQTSPENYQRGIDDNKAMLQDLRVNAQDDQTMSQADKSAVLGAIDQLGLNLGTDPGAKINEIMGSLAGVDPDAVGTYVEPYVARVLGQQDGPARNSQPAPEFGGKTDVSLATSLANAFDVAKGQVFAKGRDFKQVLQEMSLAAQKSEGIDLTKLDEANIDRLADFVVADALEAIKDNANAIGWYDRTIKQALETVGKLHPEVLTDPKAKLQLIWAVAVTSNGLKVDKNFEIALEAYQGLRATGRFPTDVGIGQAASAINGGLAQYHTMLAKFNRMSNSDEGAHDLLIEFMNSQVPVKQLEKEYGVKISGEGQNTLVRGASILGPKIGNGFFSNLYGNFDELTMDRWLMRSVGRWRGSLITINKPMISKKTSEIQGMLSAADLKGLKPLFAGSAISPTKNMSKAKVELLGVEIAKLSMDPDWRKAINAVSGGADLRKAGNGLAKYLDGQVEAPAGPKERAFIREVFQRGLKQLQDHPEINNGSNTELTMSDLQALLWYPEKRLYDAAKQKDGEEVRGYEDDEAPDYANAARKAVAAKTGGDRLGSAGGTGPAGGGPIGPNDGQPRQSIPGGGGILTGANPPNNPPIGNPPEISEVKQQAGLANASIEIGKKGGEFENGIKDMAGVKRLAQAYGIAIKFYNSNTDMRDAVPTASEGAAGAYQQRAKVANVVRTGDLNELVTTLHETLHGVGASSATTGNFLGELNTQNGLTGQPDVVGVNSIEGIMDFVLGKAKNDPIRLQVLSELKHIQERGQFSRNGVSVPIRGAEASSSTLARVKRHFNDIGRTDFESRREEIKRDLKDHQNYERSIGELTVDALIMYAHDPKTMKRVAPATAQMIREVFQKTGNKKIQFYSHPMAMVVAVIMAVLAKSQAPEEEEQQMPPGALSPQAGMLSA